MKPCIGVSHLTPPFTAFSKVPFETKRVLRVWMMLRLGLLGAAVAGAVAVWAALLPQAQAPGLGAVAITFSLGLTRLMRRTMQVQSLTCCYSLLCSIGTVRCSIALWHFGVVCPRYFALWHCLAAWRCGLPSLYMVFRLSLLPLRWT